jgi:hypothetical protein
MPVRVVYSSKGLDDFRQYLQELNPSRIIDRDGSNIFASIRERHIIAHACRAESMKGWDPIVNCKIPEGAATRIWFRDGHEYLEDRDCFCNEGEALYRKLLEKTGSIEIRDPISKKTVKS